MLERGDVSRLLDILGNRNRRRIIELLGQKPCFVTEISERLLLSPKAVIEHLQLMEREQILGSYQDERRRKYYYLSHDINLIINLQKQDDIVLSPREEDRHARITRDLVLLRRMIRAHDELLENLEHLEGEIESRFAWLMGEGIFTDEGELKIILALVHSDMELGDLEEMCGLSADELKKRLGNLMKMGIVEKTNNRYRISVTHGG
ncbi:ArsR/SmtB family transcription factor [Methanoculleus receptaculi]|uniref:ArsR family transcriptional regulator n=1 Tax=Methanoculleus receptaculi TaxID=394967 RepID=A0AAX4FUE8_9EURY|nr:ArsR family transcriptional regulator [Methanoculleus receptaculi]WOX57415.1 ArsR family transcriptional regulator [Methanoculleus receptaculi]